MVRKFHLSAMALALIISAGSAMSQGRPARSTLKVERDLEYAAGLKLDLYYVSTQSTKPLVVWFHDGTRAPTPVTYLVTSGYAVANVAYRPGQINDAQAAVNWLRSNAAKYDLDANSIAVAGDDKGGQIAAMLGGSGGVQAVIDIYGMVEKVAPPAHAAAMPAFLIVHGTADTTVPITQSEKFIYTLKAAGADATMEYVTGAGHDLHKIVTAATTEVITGFLDRVLRTNKHERMDMESIVLQADAFEDPFSADSLSTRYETYATAARGPDTLGSYRLYLPPDYNDNKSRRYPVIYYLHGANNDSRTAEASNYVQRLDAAIRSKTMPPTIVIVVQAPNMGWYVDSKDGKIPIESVIVKNLISHVDATYRTIARREGRAIEGHSMGGFGALRLGFKYPELFGTVASFSAALVDLTANPGGLTQMFGNDPEYFKAQTPAAIAEKNADKLRGHTTIRMIVGDKDALAVQNRAFDELLTRLNIPHEFHLSIGAPHAVKEVLARLDFNPFEFYAKAFAPLHLQ